MSLANVKAFPVISTISSTSPVAIEVAKFIASPTTVSSNPTAFTPASTSIPATAAGPPVALAITKFAVKDIIFLIVGSSIPTTSIVELIILLVMSLNSPRSFALLLSIFLGCKVSLSVPSISAVVGGSGINSLTTFLYHSI